MEAPWLEFSLVSFPGSYRRIRVEAVHKFSIEIIVEGGLLGSSKKTTCRGTHETHGETGEPQ